MTIKINGRYHASGNKKYNTLIILVHHLGGVPEQLKHHITFLNQNGFDVYSYPAFLSGKNHWKDFLPIIKNTKEGVVKVWSKELEEVSDQFKEDKIIFSFSFPSLSALLTASKRKDIKALICDGGPFSHLFLAVWRFFTYHQPIPNIFFKLYLTIQMYLAFKPSLIKRNIKKQLPNLHENRHVVSLQSLKDRQIPSAYINSFFNKIKHINLSVCQLKYSGHLQGLKTERETYISGVLDFLKNNNGNNKSIDFNSKTFLLK